MCWSIFVLVELPICLISFPFSLAVGYVFFPDGKKAGIEWSNASLAEMADDGVIKDEYGVSFMAGKPNAAQIYLPVAFWNAVNLVEERLFSEILCDHWSKCIILHPEKFTYMLKSCV